MFSLIKEVSVSRISFALLVLLISIAGCNNYQSDNTAPMEPANEALFTTQLDAGKIDVMKYDLDREKREFTLSFNVLYSDNVAEERTLSIKVPESNNSFVSTLKDKGGNLLWEMEYANLPDLENSFSVSEKTAYDELRIERIVGDDYYSETYNLNGDKKEYFFPTSDYLRVNELHNALIECNYANAEKICSANEEEAVIVRTLQEFDQDLETDNTLYDNRDGFLTTNMLTNDSLAIWIYDEYNDEPMEGLTLEELCLFAAECVILKCPYFGTLNPLCDLCIDILIVCVIIYILVECD